MKEKFAFSISKRSCIRLWKKYKECRTVDDLPRSGRPHKFTVKDERAIRRSMLRDRRKTPRQVVGELKAQFGKTATSRTVRNVLKKYGLRRCVAVRRPLLTKKMRLARLQWVREHCNWSVDK